MNDQEINDLLLWSTMAAFGYGVIAGVVLGPGLALLSWLVVACFMLGMAWQKDKLGFEDLRKKVDAAFGGRDG